MFANFVDDALMNITCAIRGEDHLSNTAGQTICTLQATPHSLNFWHMPILCNIDGKNFLNVILDSLYVTCKLLDFYPRQSLITAIIMAHLRSKKLCH